MTKKVKSNRTKETERNKWNKIKGRRDNSAPLTQSFKLVNKWVSPRVQHHTSDLYVLRDPTLFGRVLWISVRTGTSKVRLDTLKTVTYAKISPRMVNPRDLAGERWRRRRRLDTETHLSWIFESAAHQWTHQTQYLWTTPLLREMDISYHICIFWVFLDT